MDAALVARILNAIVVAALTLLCWQLAQRLAGDTAGLAAALIFAWWAPVYGQCAALF